MISDRDVAERIRAADIGEDRNFAAIELEILIGINEDSPAGERGFAGIAGAIGIEVGIGGAGEGRQEKARLECGDADGRAARSARGLAVAANSGLADIDSGFDSHSWLTAAGRFAPGMEVELYATGSERGMKEMWEIGCYAPHC